MKIIVLLLTLLKLSALFVIHKGEGEEVAYSKTYTKDPMRGYNHFLGSPEITNQAFDPGFKSQIFQQDKWNTGYLVTPSLICDVASSTTEVSDESTYKKSESSRSGSGGGFDLMGATVGGASSSASSNSYGKNSYSEKNLYITNADCETMKYQLSPYHSPKFTKNFENYLNEILILRSVKQRYEMILAGSTNKQIMLERYDEVLQYYRKMWFDFFNVFGTAFIVEMTTGSRYRTYTYIEKKEVEEFSTEGSETASAVAATIDLVEMAQKAFMAFATFGMSAAMEVLNSRGYKGMMEKLPTLKQAMEGGAASNNSSPMYTYDDDDNSMISSITSLLGPMGGMSSGLGDITKALGPLSGGGGEETEKKPGDNVDNCKVGQLCFTGSDSEVSQKTEKWGQIETKMESTTWSYGARPVRAIGNEKTSTSLAWATDAEFSPLPVRYEKLSIDKLFDPKQKPYIKSKNIVGWRSGAQQMLLRDCLSMLVEYCYETLESQDNKDELCRNYKRGLYLDIKNETNKYNESIRIHLLTTTELIGTNNGTTFYRVRDETLPSNVFLLGDFMANQRSTLYGIGISSDYRDQFSPARGIIDLTTSKDLPNFHYFEMTDGNYYKLAKIVCQNGFVAVGGIIVRPRFVEPKISIKKYVCIKKSASKNMKWDRFVASNVQKFLVAVKMQWRQLPASFQFNSAKRSHKHFEEMVWESGRISYPEFINTTSIKEMQRLFTVHTPSSKSVTNYRIQSKLVTNETFNSEFFDLSERTDNQLSRIRFEYVQKLQAKTDVEDTDGCGSTCSNCATLKYNEQIRLIFKSGLFMIKNVTIESCCNSAFKAQPLVYLSTAEWPLRDFQTNLLLAARKNNSPNVTKINWLGLYQKGSSLRVSASENKTIKICSARVMGIKSKLN